MDYDACREMQRELVYRLKRELTFYRSLYVLIQRQRDAALSGSEAELARSYGELDTILAGLRESQFAISALKDKEPELFAKATRVDPVPELVAQAHDVLEAAKTALAEGRKAARAHYRKLQAELARLGREDQAIKAYQSNPEPGRLLDGTR
jgi:hypothetical protein